MPRKQIRRRTPVSNKLVRAPISDAERLLRSWRRVLERRLRSRLSTHVALEIHDNTHTMISFERSHAGWHLRLHHMFLRAEDEVLDALAIYVRRGDPDASAQLDRFIEKNRALIRRISPARLQKRLRLEPRGDHHDLHTIFQSLNRRYFKNRVNAAITYGPAPKRRGRRKSIKMGSYSADSRVIRIHPVLDQPRVPRFFVEWIVFHEMLHHIHRARRREDGRRCVHTPEFVEHERRFYDFERARRWEDANLELLLTSPVR